MYEITVTREFERWFEALESTAAEQVATALEVLESAGPALDPVKASRYLLWYDGVAGAPFDPRWAERFIRLREAAETAQHLMLWQKEVVRCLESPAFLARLTQLDRETAHRTFMGIERVKERIRAGKMQINFVGHPKAPLPTSESVKRGLSEVFSLAGVEPDDVVDSSSGLREMTLDDAAKSPTGEGLSPRVRLIYGIDVPKQRILVILGEPLDRAFYGDSVRLAERKWREYCAITTAHQTWER
jgi:hypothetical protein